MADIVALGTPQDAVVAAGADGSIIAQLKRIALDQASGGIPSVATGILTTRVNYTTAQTDTAIITATGTQRIQVFGIVVTTDGDGTSNPGVLIGFGAAATPTGAGVIVDHRGINPGSGIVYGNGAGVIGEGAAAEDLRITSDVPTGGSISVVVSYKVLAA